ncbi:response regulator [Metabacillus halosaccharovorans]|uniref:response regulator n=1 Tax=Metabacillus halosaccharovorans TaxID=930124 RepID=UPI001C200C67|nr:response regulator [Metabacillus halosaccharovorans]MBU7591367.1 response regulator [Metabacillus halosaccharovorans]
MYKVIVVEDDRIIRRGICQSIQWEEHGFTIAGQAGDGEVALELIEKVKPQVVISDINMPFMNGLEMGKKIKEISPETRIIFLTGYEDFKYAHQALKLKAFDYLLKPVDSELMLSKVQEAAADWEDETKKEMRMKESLPYLQQKFFQQLIREGDQRMDVEKELAELGVELEGPSYAALLVHSPASFSEESNIKIVEITSSLFLQGNFIVINIDPHENVIIFSLDDEDDNRKCQLAQQLFDSFTDHSPTITFGRTYPNLFELGKSLIESRLAMDMKHIMGTCRVFSFEDTVSSSEQTENRLKELEIELESNIKLGIPEKVSSTLKQLNKTIVDQKSVPLTDLKILTLKFSTMLFFEVEKWRKEVGESFNSSDFYKEIIKMETLSEMMGILNGLILQWCEEMYKKHDKNHFSHVDQAIKYMNEHYHDSTLTLKKVAEFIHVSTPYLSNLFKLEKGFNFGDYLVEIRMKKAMEELRNPDIKTYEVCEKVGYNNPQYFGICFKKFTGYTPAEYKKQFRKLLNN